jgi:hypothetical protein
MFDEYAYADADVDPESSMSEDDPLRRDPAHTLSTDRTAVSHSASGLASASGRRDRSSITVCEDHIPHSTRPVPAPLQVRAAPDNTLSPVPSSSLDSKLGNESSEYGGGRHRFNFFRRRQSTHIDRDTARLQQLGYDAVLGRDYTFWSSLGIAMLNLGFIQVCGMDGPRLGSVDD